MHAGNDACWARGILGGSSPAGLASETAAWLMALSWLGHKGFCLCLIQPMLHRARRESGTQGLKSSLHLSLFLSLGRGLLKTLILQPC